MLLFKPQTDHKFYDFFTFWLQKFTALFIILSVNIPSIASLLTKLTLLSWDCCSFFSSNTRWLANVTDSCCSADCQKQWTVASLGWVTPRAATEGATPLCFPEKPGDLFLVITVSASSAVSPLFIFSCKNWSPFFAHHCITVTFYWMSLKGVTRGSLPPLSPPSDATGNDFHIIQHTNDNWCKWQLWQLSSKVEKH